MNSILGHSRYNRPRCDRQDAASARRRADRRYARRPPRGTDLPPRSHPISRPVGYHLQLHISYRCYIRAVCTLDGERMQRVAWLALGCWLACSGFALPMGLRASRRRRTACGTTASSKQFLSSWFSPSLAASLACGYPHLGGGLSPGGGLRASLQRMQYLAVALLSPIDALADVFFAVHMGQHLMLMLLAAPLLAVSDAHLMILRLLPLSPRRRFGQAIGRIPGMKQASRTPIGGWAACGAFAAAFGLWHIPAAYDWALRHPWGHALEHLTLVVTAVAFWRMIVTSGRRRLSPGMAVMMVSLMESRAHSWERSYRSHNVRSTLRTPATG